METWEEIRDEVAGMLADGQPLEDVLAKLEKRKNEMAKPMTNEEWLHSLNTEQLAEFLTKIILDDKRFRMTMVGGVNETKMWLKQPHQKE